MTYRVEAIILSAYEAKEVDRIYSILSREQGKMRIIGVGTRKPRAKLASGLDPLTKSELFLVKGRVLNKVKGVIILNQYKNLRNNYDLLVNAKQTARIVDQLISEDEASEEIFMNLKEYLSKLDNFAKNKDIKNFSKPKLLQLGLIWKTIKASGYEPDLYRCNKCNEKLEEKENYSYIIQRGVVCDTCKKNAKAPKTNLSKDSVKILRLLLSHDSETISKLKIAENELKRLNQITKITLESILDKKVIL